MVLHDDLVRKMDSFPEQPFELRKLLNAEAKFFGIAHERDLHQHLLAQAKLQ